jgi:predicted nuclease of predicted toxin-antitoxin system
LRFLVDAQLPPDLVRYLNAKGHEAEHVQAIWDRPATDNEILAFAIERAAVIVTKDSDFIEAADRGNPRTQIVWIRIGNVSNAGLRQVLDGVFAELLDALEAGEHLVEVT